MFYNVETNPELKQINAEIEEKQNQLQTLKLALKELRVRKLEIKTGFKRGDLVIDDKGQQGILEHGDTYGWTWRKLKKNGTPYQTVSNCPNNVKKVKKV